MAGETCFVIMPYGKKTDGGVTTDFDRVYDDLIKVAVEDADVECQRCKDIEHAGPIHKEMLEQIFKSDVAVVDISHLNANVFYELGVRHALAPSVTVLIRRKGTPLPFNIQGLNVIDYDPRKPAEMAAAKGRITRYIRNGLRRGTADSLVHVLIPFRIARTPKVLKETRTHPYSIQKSDKEIILVTGDIANAKGLADIWMNSENTQMEMARHCEQSISSAIRVLGGKVKHGFVDPDIVADALKAAMGSNRIVPAGSIIATDSGELRQTHKVKRIYHAAAAIGQLGRGFTPISNIETCVDNALKKADEENLARPRDKLRSILIPLMGTGQARGAIDIIPFELLNAAKIYLLQNPDSAIRQVFFICRTDIELEACKRAAADLGLRPKRRAAW
jgi:hypothetical protein